MKNFAVMIFAGFVLVGCSGAVQTNPKPSDNEIHLPDTMRLNEPKTNEVEVKREFAAYCEHDVFGTPPKSKKQPDGLFEIGYKRQKGDK